MKRQMWSSRVSFEDLVFWVILGYQNKDEDIRKKEQEQQKRYGVPPRVFHDLDGPLLGANDERVLQEKPATRYCGLNNSQENVLY